MICNLYPEPVYLFFSTEVPALLYYSHIPATVIALLVGFFVLLNGPRQLQNQLLFVLCLSFTIWTTANLILWTNIHSDILLFAWSFLGVMSAIISVFSIYFIYVFLEKKDVSLTKKTIFLLLLSPVLFFGHTNLSLTGFDITYCDAFNYEGNLFKTYHTVLGVLAMIWIAIIMLKKFFTAPAPLKKQILLMGIGIELFLVSFFTAVFLGSYLATAGIYEDSRIEMYGLFGMVIFMVFIGVLIVKFRTFKIELLASQALVIALTILVGSQFTFLHTITSKILVAVTLILTATVGIILIRSIRREVEQRQVIEGLALTLEKANTRLTQLDKLKSEFVSIASHQLRSPLTSISGYASLLREGAYGKVTKKMAEPIDRIERSARLMAESIEEYLNVSRIESGNMKYYLSDFNLVEEVSHIADDLRPTALKNGLILIFRTNVKSGGIVNADIGKTGQIIHNLLNNAIKYTQKGTISIYIRDDIKKKRIYVDILDTGVGMSTETKLSIFQKFERGDKANAVNIAGTGLGLFVALKMAEAMGGTITSESEGEGKGSRFTLELPLEM